MKGRNTILAGVRAANPKKKQEKMKVKEENKGYETLEATAAKKPQDGLLAAASRSVCLPVCRIGGNRIAHEAYFKSAVSRLFPDIAVGPCSLSDKEMHTQSV